MTANAPLAELSGRRKSVVRRPATHPLAARADGVDPGSAVPDLSTDYLQTAGRQVDGANHRHGQSVRLGADVRGGRCDVRVARSRPDHSRRTRERSAQPIVGVAGEPGQRPDRQAARRSCAYVGGCRTDHSGWRWAWTSIRGRLACCDPVRIGAGVRSCHLLDGSNSDRGALEEQYRCSSGSGCPCIALVFSSAGVPPVEMLPSWVRPVIELQPMAPTIAFMRALALGGPALWPLLLSLMWAVGLAAVVGPLAVRSYRAAAESGR